jgi:hypothetical protein
MGAESSCLGIGKEVQLLEDSTKAGFITKMGGGGGFNSCYISFVLCSFWIGRITAWVCVKSGASLLLTVQ